MSKVLGGVFCKSLGLVISMWPTKDTQQIFFLFLFDSYWVLSNFSHWFTTKQMRIVSNQWALWGLDVDKENSRSRALPSNSPSVNKVHHRWPLWSYQGHTVTETLRDGKWGWKGMGQAAPNISLNLFPCTWCGKGNLTEEIWISLLVRMCIFTKLK